MDDETAKKYHRQLLADDILRRLGAIGAQLDRLKVEHEFKVDMKALRGE